MAFVVELPNYIPVTVFFRLVNIIPGLADEHVTELSPPEF
jgi:hypothetical protein